MFWCVTAVVTVFFRAPWPALHHYFAIHVSREGQANIQALPSSRGILGSPWNLSRADGRVSLRVCIPARISPPKIKLMFIDVYTWRYLRLLCWFVTRARAWGNRDYDNQGGVTCTWLCVHELYPCESSFVIRWKHDVYVVVRSGPIDHGFASRSVVMTPQSD